jgi:hypothetical protein
LIRSATEGFESQSFLIDIDQVPFTVGLDGEESGFGVGKNVTSKR